jgi:hypothetical protein
MKGTQVAQRTSTRRSAGTSRRRSSAAESGGGKLNRDYSGEDYREPGEGYNGEQPTKGLYTATLFEVKDHTSGEGNESVRWGFRLVDGSENKHGDDVSGWPDFIYTNENTAWKEQQMLVALGVIKPGGKVNLSYDGIVKKAKPCTVRVGTERYVPEDGGDPEWRGRMQAFLPLRDQATATRGKSRRAKDEDEPAEDVFEDEDEGDEEEETPPPARSRSRRKAAEPEPEDEDEEDEEGDEDEEEDYDPDALAAELADLSLVALKKRAREEFGVKIARGMDSEDIIEAVLDTLDEDEEDEDEPEEEEPPPPPKRASRSRAGAKPATRRKARGSSEDPPF